jgi:hypothetical protein
MADDGGQVTQLLKAMRAGDPQAAQGLLPLVYAELHRLAKSYMRRERPDHTLQATALINEAYLRLAGEEIDWKNRAHFIGLSAQVMRRVLVDHARAHNAESKTGDPKQVTGRTITYIFMAHRCSSCLSPLLGERDIYLCPAGEELTYFASYKDANGVRRHAYRPATSACRNCAYRDQCAIKKAPASWRRKITRIEEPAATIAFKTRMMTEEAKQIYKQRSQIAEFPHAWIKQRCGLRQFRCRGRWKASMEATWACLSYNITRWFCIRRKLHAAAVA